MLLGLELAFIIGTLASFGVYPLLDVSARGRRAFEAAFPVTLACAVGGLFGLLGTALPGVAMPTATLAGVLVGYLVLRISDEHVSARPRVFAADEVVVVPQGWWDDLV